MIRIRKMAKKINLKYVFGEIFLIFVGISLAIWFNNWNRSIENTRNKELIITRVKEEINSNLKDLQEARVVNLKMMENYKAFARYYGVNTDEVISTPGTMKILQENNPSFFIIKDSIKLDEQTFKYIGGTDIDLEIVELTDIAWKTAQSLNVVNDLSYNCLYELESLYNLQNKVMNGFEKITQTLGDFKGIKGIIRWLNIVYQFEEELIEDYQRMLEDIESCR